MRLMNESASQYLRDGYCTARRILPPAQIDQVFADMHRLVAQQLRRLGLACDEGEAEEATTRGDVVFMSSFSIHRSNPRGNGRLRVATSMRYENASEPHFIDRSYPFAQKCSVLTELITPDFPRRAQVSAIFETPAAGAAAGAPRRTP